jgi:hypothetical protein
MARTATSSRQLIRSTTGLVLDGSNDSVDVPVSYAVPTTAFSIVLWYKPLVIDALDRVVDNLDSGPTNGFSILHGVATAQVNFQIYNTTNIQANIISTQMKKGEWNFIVATYASNSVKLYVNGVQQGATDTSATMTAPTGRIYIGRRSSAASNFTKAVVRDFAVYSKVLTATEISALYRAGDFTSISALDIWYKLDELSGTTATDSSGNARTGALSGTPLRVTEQMQRSTVALPSTKALNFANGSTKILSVTDTAALRVETNLAFSWFTWAYFYNLGNNVLPRIVEKPPHFFCFMGDQTNGKANRLALEIQDVDTSTVEYWGSTYLTPNRWYHIGATFDNGTANIYVNGEKDAIDTLLGPYTDMASSSGNPLNWGNRSAGSRNMQGLLQGMRQYNVALTPTEARQLYHGTNVTRGLVGKWDATEGTGTSVADTSGNGYTGTVTAATWQTIAAARTAAGTRTAA